MVKNLSFGQNVNRPRAWKWLKARLPKQSFAVLAQQAPNCKASGAGHEGCVKGEAHSEAQQGVHGGAQAFQVSNETASLGQG